MIENYKFDILDDDDENGPIWKLNNKTNYIGNSFSITYADNIKNVISTAIDSLDNDDRIHIGRITAINQFICLAQKFRTSEYASALVFGYADNKLLFQTKSEGVWRAVKEIYFN